MTTYVKSPVTSPCSTPRIRGDREAVPVAASEADVGARLRTLRTERGMTQRELAGDRYTTAFVSSIEAGRRQPSTDALEYFATQLGVDAEALRDGRPSTATLELRLAEARHTQAVGDPKLARQQIEG